MAGNVDLLRTLGCELGLQSRVVEPVADGAEVVSSSRIREALRDGDPQLAARLLTRPFAIRGIVEHGDKRGRTIGYPTANLAIDSYLRPKYGIYAVTGRILATGEVLHGAANIGIRPQFEPPKELLEPYFFDFSGDLYGQEIEVAFHHFLRGEAKFDGLEALIEQMDKDCAEARRLLSAQPL
jgi:riboflavin kinase/FMN adenylyltransferase